MMMAIVLQICCHQDALHSAKTYLSQPVLLLGLSELFGNYTCHLWGKQSKEALDMREGVFLLMVCSCDNSYIHLVKEIKKKSYYVQSIVLHYIIF